MRTSRKSASNWRSASSAQRLAAAVRARPPRRPRRAAQQPREVGERRPLVVDGEDRAARRPAHAARTPARNFGSVIVTVVPSPVARVDLEPVVGAEARLQPRLDVREADAAAVAGEHRAGALGRHADAVVADAQLDVGAGVAADDRDPARGRGARRRDGRRSRRAAAARAPGRRPAAPRARPRCGSSSSSPKRARSRRRYFST